jgi:hypothetical protein
MQNYDLTTPAGKQAFELWVTQTARNEINSYIKQVLFDRNAMPLELPQTNVGSFYSFQNQSLASTTTSKAITFDTSDSFNSGVRIVDNSKITVSESGIYNIMWSGQFVSSNTSIHNATVWARINGVDVTGSSGHVSIPNKHGGVNGTLIQAWNYFFSLDAGDYVELWWSVDSTDVILETIAAGTSPTRPSAASVILTVNTVNDTSTRVDRLEQAVFRR